MPASDGLGNKIVYNGQVLYNVHTEGIDQRVLMDPTNVDFVANEVTITVTGTLHQYSPVAMGHGYNTGPALVNADNVLELFGQNRKPFQYYLGDNPVWSVWPVEAFNSRTPKSVDWLMDIADGPVVESTVMNTASDQAMRVRLIIKFTYCPCHPQIQRANLSPILSLRWWMADDIDTRTWLTRRTYRGHCKLLTREISPHLARYVVMPPLQIGFRRSAISYNELDDGRTLEWQVTDDEVYIQNPFPSCEFSGSSKVIASLSQKGINAGQVDVMLRAPKQYDKRWLLHLCCFIMQAKTNFLQASTGFRCFVQSVEYGEQLHENVVTASLQCMYTSADPNDGNKTAVLYRVLNSTFGQNLNAGTIPALGTAPPYDPQLPTYSIPGLHTLAGIFVPNIQSPCYPNRSFVGGLYNPEQQQQGTPDGHGQSPQGGGEGATAVSVDPNLSTSNNPKTPYLNYRMTQKYKLETNRGQHSVGTAALFNETSAIVAHSAPNARRTITFDASRVNAWPVVPSDQDFFELPIVEGDAGNPVEGVQPGSAIRNSLLSYDLDINSSIPSADGASIMYQMAGTAVFAMNRPYHPSERIFIPRMPNVGYDPKTLQPIERLTYTQATHRLSLEHPIFTNPLYSEGGDGGGQ